MNSYEIECKYFYYETSEYGSEIIRASTKNAALKKFAKLRNLPQLKITNYEFERWWEGDWFVKVKHIKQIS